jgi:hypothetical protein
MAGSTGLEPAASAVTGRRSNQLNYDPAFAVDALQHIDTSIRQTARQIPYKFFCQENLVGSAGLEPATFSV